MKYAFYWLSRALGVAGSLTAAITAASGSKVLAAVAGAVGTLGSSAAVFGVGERASAHEKNNWKLPPIVELAEID